MSDIAELIAAENERRRTSNGRLGYSHIGIDLDCLLALRRQGFDAASRSGSRHASRGQVIGQRQRPG